MTAGRNRHGRKDDSLRARAIGERSPRRLRWAWPTALLVSLVLGAVPAQAGTGGAAVASDETIPAAEELVFSPLRPAAATWYGPGLYGNHTACGQTLLPGTIGVAHRSLPCGATIKLAYHGKSLITQVIDRGPYTPGNAFDLTNGARLALEFSGSGKLRYAVALQFARHQ